jgi:hypothetical protein
MFLVVTPDVRTSGGQDVFFWKIFFPLFLKKMKKNPFFPLKTGPLGVRGGIGLPYTAGGMHSQNKHDRHTDSRVSLLEDNSPRDGRGSQDQDIT